MNKVKILNVSIDNLSQLEFFEKFKSGIVFTPNVDHLMKLQSDSEFYKTYQAATYQLCDSKILFFISRLLGSPIKEKISGSDLFPAFYEYHKTNEDVKIFLVGAREGVARQAQEKINTKIGRDIIVGAHSPSFGFEKNEEECAKIIDLINQSGATVLAVGVGAPKQENFICKYKDKFQNIKMFLAIGATIDFEAGNIKRAPKWISEIGLEWLYRLLAEPRRLWKRYLVHGPSFFWLIAKQKLNLYVDPFSPDYSEPYPEVSGKQMVKTIE